MSKKNNIKLKSNIVLRFGMIECEAVVECEYAVYDPQNTFNPVSFSANGSRAKHLALVLNIYEAYTLDNSPKEKDIKDVIRSLYSKEKAEVIVVKNGPHGAIIYEKEEFFNIPAYSTDTVFKIGSGDIFSAHFTYNWAYKGKIAKEAAESASLETAYYCQTKGFATEELLKKFNTNPICVSNSFSSNNMTVYIAGPFFTLSQQWMLEQVKTNLLELGFNIFSPFDDVGMHDCYETIAKKDLEGLRKSDLVFAIGDGLDSGTIYELGYATAINKKIIFYGENIPKDQLVMLNSSNIIMCNDYVTAIYKTLWEAIKI